MRLRTRLAAVAVMVAATGASLAVSTPASATTSPATKGKLVPVTVTVELPADKLAQSLGKLSIQRAGQSGTVAPAAIPYCSGGRIELMITYWVDSLTHLTSAVNAQWSGNFSCFGMAYLSISSNLFFRNNQVALGSDDVCGRQGAPIGECGDVSTFGTYPCAGFFNCNGNYSATMGLWIDVPAPYLWGSGPPECTVEFGGRTLLCVFDTPVLNVPAQA